MEERRLLTTMTGEILQPVRLYYHVLDQRQILLSLSKLRCVELDRPNARLVWLYGNESRDLEFSNPYSSIPRERRPIVLGSIYFRQQGQMVLDVRSFERATKAVVFFDKYISRAAARVTHAAVVNRLFSDSGSCASDAMKLFDTEPVVDRNPDELIESAKEWAKGKSPEERLWTAMPFLEQVGRQKLPEIEEFPVHFYEEGITSLERLLKIRQIVALEHWRGNKDFTIADLMKKII